MKLTLTNAALLMSLSTFASAATVNVNGFIDVNFTTNAALPSTLGSSYTARVGSYTGGALTTESTFAQINSTWTNVGSYTFATGPAAGYNGSFAGNPLAFTNALGLAGTNVWVWVTNGSDQNLLMQAVGSSAGAFLFKGDAEIPNSGVLSIRQSALAGWQLALGTFTSGGANAGYGGSYVLNTAVIPEPSAALLGAFGAIGLLRRRRN
jgi:hypothetical protein